MNAIFQRLGMNYWKHFEMINSSSSAMGVVASSAVRNDPYTVVGTLYKSDNSRNAERVGKSSPGDCIAHRRYEGEEQIQGKIQPPRHGNGVSGGQVMSTPINSMRQHVPRWTDSAYCQLEIAYSQQSPHPRQQMQIDDNFTSPNQSTLSAAHSLQDYGGSLVLDVPWHRNMLSNASGEPCGSWTSTNPLPNPRSAVSLRNSAVQSPVGGAAATMMRSSQPLKGGLAEKSRPKHLASALSSLPKRSSVQESAATKSKQAKSGNRTAHSDIERKYRVNLKDRLAQLRAAVPALQAQPESQSDNVTSHAKPQISKGTILRKAAEYIEELEQVNRAMTDECQQLAERLQMLEAKLQNSDRSPLQNTPHHGMI